MSFAGLRAAAFIGKDHLTQVYSHLTHLSHFPKIPGKPYDVSTCLACIMTSLSGILSGILSASRILSGILSDSRIPVSGIFCQE
jgi:hypothetical protein